MEEQETTRQGGLLEQAALIRDKTGEKGKTAIILEEPQEEIVGGLLERATLMRESEEGGTLIIEGEEVEGPSEEEIEEEVPETGKKKIAKEEILQEEIEKEKIAEVPSTPVPALVEQCLSEGYTQRVFTLFNDISGKDGYQSLCETIAETMSSIAKGKTCILFLIKNGRQTAECIYPEDSLDKKARKISFAKNSPFIKTLDSDTGKHLKHASIKDEAILKETKKLDVIQPWTAYPLPSTGRLEGFIVVGNQPKRPKLDKRIISLFLHMAGLYLSNYVMEREIHRDLEKLKAEKDENQALIDLYTNSEMFSGIEKEKILKEAMHKIYTDLEIETAALVTGWGSPGKLKVEHSIGIPKNILGKYRVSKTDKNIKSAIKSREPAVLPDAAKRISKLSKKDDDLLKTYIVVPVLFCDDVLGILNIHRMKGAGKKLTKNVKARLKHAAQSIVPFMLSDRLKSTNPWNILESFLKEETAKARQKRKPLNLAMFTIDNGKKVLDTLGFGRYWGYVERLHKIIDKNIEGSGAMRAVDWNKTIVSLREMEKGEATTLIRQIKKEFNDSFKGPKKEKIVSVSSSATVFPDVSKNLAAILAAID
jgi:GGDEF domain-containing protein